ncbi:WSC-domain-containing protein [Hortaea werneckii]|nr:WSC-domain-containing protein [Hortaea werneckii]
MGVAAVLCALVALLLGLVQSQEYAGDVISTTLPGVPGAEIAFWKIQDTKAKNNLTLINYINHGKDGKRLVPSNLKRAVIIIHGLNRDPGTYMANMLSALAQVDNKEISTDSVAIVAPFFANGDDKNNGGYPWIDGLPSGQGSYTSALVWKGSQWSAGGNAQYPYKFKNTISSYTCLDQIIQYFDNKSLFPNINQIVVAGHSLGGQTVQRYAAIGKQLGTTTPVSYWVGNPNSYVWLSADRPLSTVSCPGYDDYREGYNAFVDYPMTYATDLVASGRSSILANFNSKAVNYARGTLDLGDDSSSCAPGTTGANRNERFFNFIKAFPPSCPDPSGRNCDTVDFVVSGHDGGAMMASKAGQARLFKDNFYGNGSRAYDFGYPRQQLGDDPYPDPNLNTSSSALNNNTYAGNMTYYGCWSDQSPRTIDYMAYQSDSNTIEKCTQTCADKGYSIAGIEFGSQCFCGNALGYAATQVIDSSCQTPCPGNSSEICGGGNRLSLFSNGQPVVNGQPGTPETIGAFTYLNCYTEGSSGRALGAKGSSGSFVDLDYCASYCSGYKYFGTEYGSECYCGNTLGTGASVTLSGDCSMTCADNATQFCGAGNRLTVYQNYDFVASSSSSTTSSATQTSSSQGSSSTAVSCPGSDNTVVMSNGKNFTIECGIDHAGGDLTAQSVGSFQECIDACAKNANCVDVSLSGSACYLKSSLGAAVPNVAVWGAKLVIASSSSSTSSATDSTVTITTSSNSVSSTSTASASALASASPSSITCPSADGQNITVNGTSFLIECGIDHAGGDLSSLSVGSFYECMQACTKDARCIDVSLSGSACYLKGSLGAAVPNGVWGAKAIVSSNPSSSASNTQSSSSTVQSSSTLTSATSTSAATALSCPASDGQTVTVGGKSFLVECGTDHAGGDLTSMSVSGFNECISNCASNPSCVDVSLRFVPPFRTPARDLNITSAETYVDTL